MTDIIKPNRSLQMDGIELRTELEYPKETEHAHYTDDTQGDPEGAEVRAHARSERVDYPEWVFGNFKLSKTTYYGKPWPDKGEHLIPREVTIQEILEVHEQGMQGEFLDNCLTMGAKMNRFEILKQKYLELVDEAPADLQFGIMRGLGNSVEEALAKRAVSKFRFGEAADRANMDEDKLSDLFQRAMNDAEKAGALMWIHRAAWQSLQWKSEPKYTRVKNSIVLEQIRAAEYIDKTYGTKDQVKRAKLKEYGDAVVF